MDLSSADWATVGERAQDFTGRGWVFERIRSFLASDVRMFVIVAPPGTGKTAIAARLAQASAGRLPDETALPIPVGTLTAGVFCQAAQVSLLGVAQDLADQLSTALDGFKAEQRSTVAPSVTVSDVEVHAGNVTGGRVTGVNIDLARLGPERAFADGLALPLRRLGEKPGFQPPVLLVDSLDEAYGSPVAQKLPALLAGLAGAARLIVTTREDPRVIAAIGLEAAVAADRAVRLHLVDDAPADIDEVAGYAAARLHGHGPDDAVAVLAPRIGLAASGNFLYAYHVVAGLLAGSEFVGLNAAAAADMPLPAGGLPGVYQDFLARELGGDEERWSREVRPILAPLGVALGDGLDTTQLGVIGSVLAGRPVARSAARDVTRVAGQFLTGSQPDGPFRVYHRSFADFLLDAEVNPDWPVDPAETHAAIVDALVPRDAAGGTAWSAIEPYARTHLAEHAAAGGRLDRLLTDPGFILVADIDRLLPLLWSASSPEARDAAAVVQLAAADLRGRPDDDRASYLELAARMRGADVIADRIAALLPDRGWSVPRARWLTPSTHVRLTGHQGMVHAVAIGVIHDRPVAVTGGHDGTVRIWDLRDMVQVGEPLEGHRGEVWTVAAGTADGRPVAISGGEDATVRLWDLASHEPLGEPLQGHDDYVRSVALGEVEGRPLVVSGGSDGIRVWDPRTLGPLGEPLPSPKGDVREVAIGATGSGTVVACACGDGAVRVWAIGSAGTFSPHGDPLSVNEGWPVPVDCVAMGDLDGRAVVLSSRSGSSICLWDVGTMAPLVVPADTHNQGVSSVAIGMLDDRSVAASAGRHGIRIWDLRSMTPLGAYLVGHEGSVSAVAIGQVDGRPVVVSGGIDGTVRVWDLALPAPDTSATGGPGRLDAAVVTEVGDEPVVVTLEQRGVRTWDLATLAPRGGPVDVDSAVVGTLAVGAVDDRGVVIAGGGSGSPLCVLDIGTLERLGELVDDEGGSGSTAAAGLMDDRPIAVTGDGGGALRVWDLRAMAPFRDPIQAHDDAVLALGICEVDGRTTVVSGGDDEVIRVWDIAAPEPVGQLLEGRIGRVSCLAVGQADGRPLVVRGGFDAAIRVWDLRTLALVEKPFRGHVGKVVAVALGELDSRPVIVSAGIDGTIRIWDLRSWTQVSQISVPVLTGLAMAHPDTIVATASSGLILFRVARLPAAPASAVHAQVESSG